MNMQFVDLPLCVETSEYKEGIQGYQLKDPFIDQPVKKTITQGLANPPINYLLSIYFCLCKLATLPRQKPQVSSLGIQTLPEREEHKDSDWINF